MHYELIKYELIDLLAPTLAVFACILFICLRILKNVEISVLIAVIKSLLFAGYFGFFAKTSGVFLLDDVTYFKESSELWHQGYTFFDTLVNGDKFTMLFAVAGGSNILYYLYNIAAFDIFGGYYFAPVALNIILTGITAAYLYKLIKSEGFITRYARYYFIFFILQWDVVSWSNFLNLKDTLVHMLTVLVFYDLCYFFHKSIWNPRLIRLILVILSLTFLRFYVPFFVLTSFSILKVYAWIQQIKTRLYRILTFMVVAVVIPFILVGIILTKFNYYIDVFLADFTNPVVGAIRFLTTPLPWKIMPEYDFLTYSATMHFILIPLMLYGVYLLYKMNTAFSKMMLLYLAMTTIFYGSYMELQGPRHRLQITFIISLCQFTGLMHLVKNFSSRDFLKLQSNRL